MTGFGRSSGTGGNGEEISVDVRSVNSKTLKLYTRLPPSFLPFEDRIRSRVRDSIRRGSVTVTLHFQSDRDEPHVRIHDGVLEAYANALTDLAGRMSLEPRFDPALLASLPGAAELVEIDREASKQDLEMVLEHLDKALEAHEASRRVEGKTLARDVEARAKTAAALVEKIRVRAPEVVRIYREKLEARLKELLAGQGSSPEAFRTEVAVFAERSDIHEECVRAQSHIDAFLETVAGGGDVGRRLDFIAQEIHRELSTMNAKANDYEIARMAVEAKAEIDKIKEQVQNVE